LTTATMPLSGAARASARKLSIKVMGGSVLVCGVNPRSLPDAKTENPGRERPGFWSRRS
jgi:hypothetical protein